MFDMMNRVMFDKQAKEYVLISNGKCTLDHSSVAGYQASHTLPSGRPGYAPCEYAPSEAIALRPFVEGGKVLLAWTYRGVRPEDLELVDKPVLTVDDFRAVLTHRRSSRFIGRI